MEEDTYGACSEIKHPFLKWNWKKKWGGTVEFRAMSLKPQGKEMCVTQMRMEDAVGKQYLSTLKSSAFPEGEKPASFLTLKSVNATLSLELSLPISC